MTNKQHGEFTPLTEGSGFSSPKVMSGAIIFGDGKLIDMRNTNPTGKGENEDAGPNSKVALKSPASQDNGKIIVPMEKMTLAELYALKPGSYKINAEERVVEVELEGKFPEFDVPQIEFVPLDKKGDKPCKR